MNLSSAFNATFSNIIFQILSRVVTFLMNAFIIRYVSRDALGIINVRLLLLYTSVQFISREPFRRSCISSKSKTTNMTPRQLWHQMVNLIWLAVPLSLIVSSVFYFVWTKMLTLPDSEEFPGYETSVVVILISIIIEMTCESIIIFSLTREFYKVKLISEASSLFCRCFIMFVGAYTINPKNILHVFSFAQITSSIIYMIMCWGSYFKYKDEVIHGMQDFLFQAKSEVKFDPDDLPLTFTFVKQTVIKQLLTEGEKFVMTFFDPLSFSDQGVYDLISNLSSLAARFIFGPIEETASLIFTRLIDREEETKKIKKKEKQEVKSILQNLTKLMVNVGLTILVFGINYSKLLLVIYAGKNFIVQNINGPTLLQFQCFYVAIIAVNGITECFTLSSMNKKSLESFNQLLVVLSIGFLGLSFALSKTFGSVGFIISNSVNMLARVIYHLFYIKEYFSKSFFETVELFVPKIQVLGSFVIFFVLMKISESVFCCEGKLGSLIHLSIGSVLFFSQILVIYFSEETLMTFLKEHLKSSKRFKSE